MMNWLRIGAMALAACQASYAWAAAPEGMLGQPLARNVAGTAGALPAGIRAAGPGGAAGMARRYSGALGGLRSDGPAVTRGAKESKIYQTVSPSVVLIVTKAALGSGALISADGLIVTNMHVVGDSPEVGVVFKPAVEGAAVSEADVRRARVIHRDEVADLALIQVDQIPEGVKPLKIASASAVEVGSDVHAIGHPTGEAWTYTRGIVSQIRKDYVWRAEDKIEHKATVIQTQTPINPGNSGGPLIDDDGVVVGINSFKSSGEGLNFAVSGDDVQAFLARPRDRLIAPAKPAKACKAQTLTSYPMKTSAGVEYLMDSDCDGKGDYLIDIPKDKKEPIAMLSDDDGDGKLDTVILDQDRDGHPDIAWYDTNGDGEIDMVGHYRNHEDEPYAWEKSDPKKRPGRG